MNEKLADAINKSGYVIRSAAIPVSEINQLINELAENDVFNYESAIAVYNLLTEFPLVSDLACHNSIIEIVREVIGPDAVPLKAIIIDKTKRNNWGLDWHQDLKIAVREKKAAPGFTGWTLESGITHVIPAVNVLQQYLTVRVHLDDCHSKNGAIWVLPGTHDGEIYNKREIAEKVKQVKIVDCIANKGDVLFMYPLLLHKSPYSLTDLPRRVLQIEYSSVTLPNNLVFYT